MKWKGHSVIRVYVSVMFHDMYISYISFQFLLDTFCSVAYVALSNVKIPLLYIRLSISLRYMGQIASKYQEWRVHRVSDAFCINMRQLRENRYGKYYVYPASKQKRHAYGTKLAVWYSHWSVTVRRNFVFRMTTHGSYYNIQLRVHNVHQASPLKYVYLCRFDFEKIEYAE